MNRPQSVIVPLSEATGTIKQAFREYAARLLLTNSPRLCALKDCFDYNCVPYLQQVLAEIFADEGTPEVVGGTSYSTKMLMESGMDRTTAAHTTLQVVRIVMAQLTAFFPELVLGKDSKYQYEMCSEYDVFVTPP